LAAPNLFLQNFFSRGEARGTSRSLAFFFSKTFFARSRESRGRRCSKTFSIRLTRSCPRAPRLLKFFFQNFFLGEASAEAEAAPFFFAKLFSRRGERRGCSNFFLQNFFLGEASAEAEAVPIFFCKTFFSARRARLLNFFFAKLFSRRGERAPRLLQFFFPKLFFDSTHESLRHCAASALAFLFAKLFSIRLTRAYGIAQHRGTRAYGIAQHRGGAAHFFSFCKTFFELTRPQLALQLCALLPSS
jgi:hypothetical protein